MVNPNQEQVYRSLQQKARYLQIVNELALTLLRQSSMDDILWTVAKSAIAQLGFEDCVIYLLDESGTVLVQRAAHGPKNPAEKEILDPITIPVGKGIVGSVVMTGAPEIVRDTRLDDRYIIDDKMRLSELAVPIVHDGMVIGVIDSEHPEAGFYTIEHAEILTTIASIASTRIASALTMERLAETVAQLERTEDALRGGEERYRMLYDLHPSMFFTLDEHGMVRSANDFALMRLGYQLEALTGQAVAALHKDVEVQTVARRIARCLQEPGGIQRWESCLLTRDGTEIWVRETARAVNFKDDGGLSILVVSEDISDVRKLSQELTYQASHDVLTGLYNRRKFEAELEQALESSAQTHQEHVLLYMDLDMFKLVNDSCGHIAGDELLRQVAWLFLSLVRRSDTVARIGGDEFVLLMRSCSTEHALEVAEALRAAIEAYRFRWDEKIFSIGLSIGVHKIDHSSMNVAAVLSAADTACYMAKEYGRNRIHVYSHCDEKVRQRSRELHWVKRLQDALDERRFRLFAQPIASLKPEPNPAERYEVLLRMVDENGDLVSPKVFLPAAERFGMSMRLDRYVISWTLEWLARHPRDPDRPLICAINVSGFSLGSSDFLEHVIGELQRTNVPASMVCIEITETAAIANFSSAQRFIRILREKGCRFALDDFGSGLTSFAYLKNLPVDFLKFDGLYARDILKDPINHALVKAMNHIAQMMQLQTIAEFVETEAVFAELTALGLDYAQGYFIGQPRPIEEVIK